MRALLFATLLLTALAPAAAADTFACVPAAVAFACAGDASASQGSCSTAGYAYGYDTAMVFSPVGSAFVYAGHSCYTSPTLRQEGTSISADAFSPVVAAQFQWAAYEQTNATGEYSYCSMDAHVGTSFGWNSVSQPCAAGAPPNAGWGDLLP